MCTQQVCVGAGARPSPRKPRASPVCTLLSSLSELCGVCVCGGGGVVFVLREGAASSGLCFLPSAPGEVAPAWKQATG